MKVKTISANGQLQSSIARNPVSMRVNRIDWSRFAVGLFIANFFLSMVSASREYAQAFSIFSTSSFEKGTTGAILNLGAGTSSIGLGKCNSICDHLKKAENVIQKFLMVLDERGCVLPPYLCCPGTG